MAEFTAQVISLIILLFLSGFFSGAEVALISLSDAKLQTMLDKRKYGSKHIQKLKEHPQRMLSAILIGNNVVNIAAASLMTVVMLQMFGSYAVGIATGVMTLLILIFGEITPKSIATQNSEGVSQIVGPPIWYFSVLLRPVLVVFDFFITGFLRILGLKATQSQITEDEIRHMVSAAAQEGSIQKIEKNLITNILEIDETTVGEIITPWADVVTIAADSKISAALRLVSKKKHSRIPVYEKEKDNIVGILYLRDLLEQKRTLAVKKIMETPYVVPETKSIGDILRKFQRRKEHLAIVVDEHGNVTGIVTLEDVLEEIVGEIVDESETIEPNIKKVKSTWHVRGRASIDEVNEQLPVKIPEGDYDTLSGFILERLGHIPGEGEEFKYAKRTFTIKEVKRHRIAKVVVKR